MISLILHAEILNPTRPLLRIQPNLTVSIFLDHPVYKADYSKFKKANSKDYEALARIKICCEGVLSISRIDWISFFGQYNFFPPFL